MFCELAVAFPSTDGEVGMAEKEDTCNANCNGVSTTDEAAIKHYADMHKFFPCMQAVMELVLKTKPDNPFDFVAQHLASKPTSVPTPPPVGPKISSPAPQPSDRLRGSDEASTVRPVGSRVSYDSTVPRPSLRPCTTQSPERLGENLWTGTCLPPHRTQACAAVPSSPERLGEKLPHMRQAVRSPPYIELRDPQPKQRIAHHNGPLDLEETEDAHSTTAFTCKGDLLKGRFCRAQLLLITSMQLVKF
eukprot:2285676-Amphidinium_carterae.1